MIKEPKLSICMPSHRSLIDSQGSIDSAITYSLQRKLAEVSISDNSGDESKSLKYSMNQSGMLKYSNTNGLNESENWFSAAYKSSGAYIGFLADDDYLLAVGPTIEYNLDKNIVGYRPNFAVWEEGRGIICTSTFSIQNKTAKERVASYFKNARGNNNTLYSFIQRDISLEINSLVMNHHPTKGGYYDWAIVLAYLSCGVLLPDHSSLYVYDNCNWSGTQDQVNSRIMGLMKKCGLSSRGLIFLPLMLAIDSFILIARESSPIDRVEVLEAASFAFQAYANNFLNFYSCNKSDFTEMEILTIETMINTRGLSNLLTAALKTIEAFEPKIIDQYKIFYLASIGKPWGKF